MASAPGATSLCHSVVFRRDKTLHCVDKFQGWTGPSCSLRACVCSRKHRCCMNGAVLKLSYRPQAKLPGNNGLFSVQEMDLRIGRGEERRTAVYLSWKYFPKRRFTLKVILHLSISYFHEQKNHQKVWTFKSTLVFSLKQNNTNSLFVPNGMLGWKMYLL